MLIIRHLQSQPGWNIFGRTVDLREDETFAYDPIGNWTDYETAAAGVVTLDQSRVHDTSNILTEIDGSDALLAHDASGNMILVPPVAGDWEEARTLVWDAWNRLVKIKNESGAVVAQYAYDGTWRRTTKTVAGTVTHFYYNSQWRPVEEREGSATTPARTYDWGIRYRDDLIRRKDHVGGDIHYALHDYYNVTAITDAEGEVVERYGYSTFGEVRYMDPDFDMITASSYGWDLLFKGQSRDSESGFYNYGYRYYSTALGRWISRDPIWEEGGTNLYAFTENNAPNKNDLLGLEVGSLPFPSLGLGESIAAGARRFGAALATEVASAAEAASLAEAGVLSAGGMALLALAAMTTTTGAGEDEWLHNMQQAAEAGIADIVRDLDKDGLKGAAVRKWIEERGDIIARLKRVKDCRQIKMNYNKFKGTKACKEPITCTRAAAGALAFTALTIGRSVYEDKNCGDIPWNGGPAKTDHSKSIEESSNAAAKCWKAAVEKCGCKFDRVLKKLRKN